MVVEVLGIVASLFIIAAFSCKNVALIRVLDGVGAVLYIVYGALIGSISVMFLNAVLVAVQLFRLWQLRRER